MRRVGLKALVIAGWLLTPLVAGAASFLGAWLGARLSPSVPPAGSGVVEMIVGGGLLAITAVTLWLAILRRLGRPRAAAPAVASAARQEGAS